jgi:hypothetical protein
VARFLVVPREVDLDLVVRWGVPKDPPGVPSFESGSLWRAFRDGESTRFSLAAAAYGSHPYTLVTVNPTFTLGEILLNPVLAASGAPVYPLQYPLDEVLFVNLLARGCGIEVHGCGIVDEAGHGLLFVGHSGAGKSTTAELWASEPGVRVLSDERIVVRRQDDQLRMYGTPWHSRGRHACPESAVLRRVLVLEHGPANELLPLRGGAAASALLSRSFVPHYCARGLDSSLSFVSQLVEAVPCETFHFVPDCGAVAAVRGSHPWVS